MPNCELGLLGSSPSNTQNALVAQLVEAMRLDRIQCQFESDLGYNSLHSLIGKISEYESGDMEGSSPPGESNVKY